MANTLQRTELQMRMNPILHTITIHYIDFFFTLPAKTRWLNNTPGRREALPPKKNKKKKLAKQGKNEGMKKH